MRGFARKVRRWLSRGLARIQGKLYEGPGPTDRLLGFTHEFMALYPNATRLDWLKFAYGLGEEMYRSGYTRGYEYALAEVQLLPPPEQNYEWNWSAARPTTADVYLNERIPLHEADTPEGMTPEQAADYYQWRRQDEFDRMRGDKKV